MGGKDLARTVKAIRNFVKYPVGFRGCCAVININYEKLVKDKRDIAYSKGRDSPCVKFALKAHLINISDSLDSGDRAAVIKELCGKQISRLSAKTVGILNAQDVDMSGIVTIKDITKMENRLKSPIILYALNNAVAEALLNAGMEDDEVWEGEEEGVSDTSFIDDTEADESGSMAADVEYDSLNDVPENENENQAGYYIACIRAPTRQTL